MGLNCPGDDGGSSDGGQLGAGQVNRLEKCSNRRLSFLHKLPSSSFLHTLPEWKLRKPDRDVVSPVCWLNYIVAW